MSKYSEKKERQRKEQVELEERLNAIQPSETDEAAKAKVVAAAKGEAKPKPVTDFTRKTQVADCAKILKGARQILKEQAEELWHLKEDAEGIEKGRIVNAMNVTELAANKVAWAIEQLEAVK